MDLVEEQLTQSKTIAVVGLSDNPERASCLLYTSDAADE